ncbi:hypothetical protein KIPB_011449 [Kipferlia bialata]|uniref:Uncharacterized protein n=1 Tax=Kipferlia bialata TaxID=797122 RepID=A0A9K3D7J5_9EUKA|nr:hypothetical protein KIPB_011449 [Kipferlia bialata]|eukprot:g11449.t1
MPALDTTTNELLEAAEVQALRNVETLPWNKTDTKNDVDIYLTSVPGSKYAAVMGKGQVAAPVDDVVASLCRCELSREESKKLKLDVAFRTIVAKLDNEGMILYFEVPSPVKLIKGRTFLLARKVTRHAGGKKVYLTHTSVEHPK